MTRKEVSELFGVMALAWPGAEIFRRQDDIPAAITLWTRCLSDVEAKAAQQGLMRLCRQSKWMPSVAELRSEALTVQADADAHREAAEAMHLIGEGGRGGALERGDQHGIH